VIRRSRILLRALGENLGEAQFCQGEYFVDRYVPAKFGTERCNASISDATGDDSFEPTHIAIAVEGEPVHGCAAGNAHADGSNLSLRTSADEGFVGGHPDSATSLDAHCCQAKVGTDVDQGSLKATHMGNDIDGLGEANDGVANKLARAVPRDSATAIYVHHWSAIRGSILGWSASSGGVHRRMLEQQDGVRTFTTDNSLM
jgi:hypothetical protein